MDNPDTPEPAWEDRGQIFWRLIPMIFFGIIAYLALWLIFVLALIQFVAVVAAEKPNDQLSGFARRLIRYVGEIFRYLMFTTDAMPFPFADFPEGESGSPDSEPGRREAAATSGKTTGAAAKSAGETSGDPRQSAPAGKKSANNKKSGKTANTAKKSGSTGSGSKKSGKGKAAKTQASGKAGNSG